MCELLGMSANTPTDICFSFTGLSVRGGKTGPHTDGWGIAFYDGRACRAFHEAAPSAESAFAAFVRDYPIKSCVVVSHVRQATHGRVCLANTHPFVRELWGRHWCFAHNGKLPGVKDRPLGFYQPVGTTDSEHAFCWLLDAIRTRFPKPPRRPASLHRFVYGLAEELRGHGTFNMLLSDATHLFAYCTTKLCWITRRAPFGVARLLDTEVSVDFKQETTPNDIVTIVATQPLTRQEVWHRMAPGEMVVFREGLPAPVTWAASAPAD
ncbi:MAG: class II glutamine amidotransferase [Myxococcales bacterium]|nr:class II glutamine amidotransferase [Myxococcales bacterium]